MTVSESRRLQKGTRTARSGTVGSSPRLAVPRDSDAKMRPAADRGSHVHYSALSLALDLQDSEGAGLRAVAHRTRACQTCGEALRTLDYWLSALGHHSPGVGPEFLTRHRLLVELFAPPDDPAERLIRATTDEVFHQWGLCRLLLEESREAFPAAGEFSFHLADLAWVIAGALDPHDYGPRWAADLRAEIAAHLGCLHRRRGDRRTAADHLREARRWFSQGTGRAEVSRRLRFSESLLTRGQPEPPATADGSASSGAADEADDELRLGPLAWLLHL